MGKMHDALKKAEEEREAKRRAEVGGQAPTPVGGMPLTGADSSLDATQRVPVTEDFGSFPGASPAKTLTGGIPTTASVAARPRTVESRRQTPVPESTAPVTRGVDPRLIAVIAPADPRVEQFRTIRTSLQTIQPEPRAIVVTSALANEGKAMTAANLSVILAEDGRSRVLLIDGDLRGGTNASLFGGATGVRGFSDVMLGHASPGEVVQDTGIAHLHFVGAGTRVPNPGGLLSGPGLGAAIRQWRAMFDRVVISAPPCVGMNDAHLIGRECEGAVIVVKLGATPRRVVNKAYEALAAANVRILGAILTDAKDVDSEPASA